LFGSLARGEGQADSDVDVAVLYGKPVEPSLAGLKLDLAGDLEERLGRRVDLVVLDNQPPDLVHRVLRDGLLVLENNRSARIRFEVTARNEYFDVLPTRACPRLRRGRVAVSAPAPRTGSRCQRPCLPAEQVGPSGQVPRYTP